MNGVELVASWFTPTVLFCVLNLMIGTIFITSSLQPHKRREKLGGHDDEQPPQLVRVPSLLERVKSINLSSYWAEESDPVNYTVPAQEQAAHHQHKQQERLGGQDDEQLQQIVRVPSFFERVKSIDLSRYWAQESDQVNYAVRAQEQAAHHQHKHQERLGGQDDEQLPQIVRVPSFFERVKSINVSRYRAEQCDPVQYAVPAQEQEAHQQEPEYETEEPHHVRRSKSDTMTQAAAVRVLKKCASEKVEAVGKGEEEVEAGPRRPATMRERTAASGGEDELVDAKADDFINRFRQQLKLQRLDSLLRYREMLNRGTGR